MVSLETLSEAHSSFPHCTFNSKTRTTSHLIPQEGISVHVPVQYCGPMKTLYTDMGFCFNYNLGNFGHTYQV